MSEEEKEATDIIHKYRMLLMDEGEDFGEEVLVSVLSEKMALIHVNGVYNSLIEKLFNLRACRVIVSEKVYLHRLQELNAQRDKVKSIIESKSNDR